MFVLVLPSPSPIFSDLDRIGALNASLLYCVPQAFGLLPIEPNHYTRPPPLVVIYTADNTRHSRRQTQQRSSAGTHTRPQAACAGRPVRP
jgi:hypothetical protein